MSKLKDIVIVYVEDEDAIRSKIASFLKRRVKGVYEASNGKDGVELIKEYNPHVVITDIEMPIMNGLEMIKVIRELYDGKKPIIVITGYKDEQHYTDEADAYLYKPINLHKLIDTIEMLIKKSQP